MTTLADPGTRVVLMGTGTHGAESGLPSVPEVSSTLTDLGQALVQRCGLAEDHLRIVVDPANPSEMGTVLAEAAEEATGVLLVFFVGHGMLGPGGDLYLATRSTDIRPSRLAHTATAYAALRNSLLDSNAAATVVLLDCCFSGRAVRVLGSAEDAASWLTEIRGTYVLTSAAGEQLALIPEGEPHTAFTGELIRLLWEGDPAGPAQVTLDHVYRYLSRALPARNCPRPHCLAEEAAGQLVLTANRAYHPPDPPGKETTEPESDPGEVCPYPGMAAFSAADAQWFFGRDHEVEQLLARLVDQLASRRPLVLVAASGAGKSSLLGAGLLPALADGGLPVPGSRNWPRLLLTPTDHPVRELAWRTASLAGATVSATLDSAIRADPGAFADALREVLRERAGGHDDTGARVIVVVDQFEEAFTQYVAEDERRTFLEAVRLACTPGEDGGEPPALVVLGLRADFYSRCAAAPWLRSALQDNQVFLGPLDIDQLRASIGKPAETVGLRLQPGLVDLLLHDLDVTEANGEPATYEPGMLPLLAHALRATWHNREGRTLTIAGYRATKGIRHAIASTAEDAYGQLDPRGQQLARALLLRMIQIGEGTEDTRRRIDRDVLARESADPATAEAVLDALARARLITLDQTSAEITHEALLDAWPQLRGWINTDRAGLLIRQQLNDAAEAWDREGRHPADLYQGPRLAAADEWAAGSIAELAPLAADFLNASRQRQRDVQRAARRRTRRLRQLVAALTALLVLAAGATIVAIRAQNIATQQRDEALSQRVAGEARTLRSTNPALAAQLGLAAYRQSPTVEARSSLLTTFAEPYATRLTGHGDDVDEVAFSPDGRLLATASQDKTARLWDVTIPHRPLELATLTEHTAGLYVVTFSPSGRILATAGDDKTVRLWDVSDPRHPRVLTVLSGHTERIESARFGPDERTLVTGSMDGTVRLWDVTDPRRAIASATVPGHAEGVWSVAFSANSGLLGTAGADRTARLWEVRQGGLTELAVLRGHTDRVYGIDFSKDGQTAATISLDNTTRLWDISTRNQPRELSVLSGHTDAVTSVHFHPAGHLLATGSDDFTIRLWQVNDRSNPAPLITLTGHTDEVDAVVFSPDGQTLVTGSNDRSVRLWDLGGIDVRSHTGAVNGLAYSPDGRLLASTSWDRTARLWDMTDARRPKLLSILTGHTDGIWDVAFSPDGKTLATASADRTIRLWHVSDPRKPTVANILTGHAEQVISLAFSPDGRGLASHSDDTMILLWDLTNPPVPPHAMDSRYGLDSSYTFHVDYGPDRPVLATASEDGLVRLWDVSNLRDPRKLATLEGHSTGLYQSVFSREGRLLVSAGEDGTLRLWDVTDPRRAGHLATLTGHAGTVYRAAFGPGDRMLASAGNDGTVRLWELADLRRPSSLAVLSATNSGLTALAISPDGHTIVTGGEDHAIRLWNTSVDTVAARICELAAPRITEAEWRQYFRELPYAPPCASS